MQGLTNHWAAQPGREGPWLYLAGEWEVTAHQAGFAVSASSFGLSCLPFSPCSAAGFMLGRAEKLLPSLSSVGCGLAGCISWLVSGQGDKACLEKGSCFGS